MCSILDKIETASSEVNSSTKLLALLVEDRFKLTEKQISNLNDKLDNLINKTTIVLDEYHTCPVNENKENVQLIFTIIRDHPIIFKFTIFISTMIGLFFILSIMCVFIYGVVEMITTGKSTIIDIIIKFVK